MKANRRPGAHADDDQGIAVVVGTVMLVGIVLTTLVTVQPYFVPVWEENDEAARLQTLSRQMAELKADIDRQTDNDTAVPVAAPISLGREDSSIFGSNAGGAASLEFVAGNAGATINATRLLLQTNNLTGGEGVNETWVNVTGNQTVADVLRVQSFRLRVRGFPGALGNFVTARINDTNGVFAGNLTYYVSNDNPDWTYNVRSCNANGCSGNDKLYDQGVSFHSSSGDIVEWIVDLMDPEYRFDKLLAATAGPLRINLTQAGFTAEYAITYIPVGGSGGSGGSGSGGGFTVVPDYNATFAGGTLRLRSDTTHLPRQTYVLEHGAMVLDQPEGAVFKVEPSFAVRLTTNYTTLTVGLPTLMGNSSSISTAGLATVRSASLGANPVVGQAPEFRMNLTTAYPGLWAGFWATKLTQAGLAAGSGFNVTSGSTWAAVAIQSISSDPAIYDILLTLKQADIQVQI